MFRSGVFTIPDDAGTAIAPNGSVEFGNIQYERDAQYDPIAGHPLKGEYGVLRRFSLTVPQGQTLALYQSTGAPGATASYIVDDVLFLSHKFASGDGRFKIKVVDARNGSQTVES